MMQTQHQIVAEIRPSNSLAPFTVPDLSRVSLLTEAEREGVLTFLAVRPVQTVVMSSFIVDNGVTSELNRGHFYAYRGNNGDIEGIALIGHSTLVEARSDAALAALAYQARRTAVPIHLIMARGSDAERFHMYLTGGQTAPRLTCTEALFEASYPFAARGCEFNVVPADRGQLNQVAAAQAEIACIECGVDPLIKDREGFMKRVQRRIEQNRVLSVFDDGILIFKADIIAETPTTIYLEGVYVHPDHRGKGVGSRCLAVLTQQLLERADNVCLLSNVEFGSAHRTFERAGYRRTDICLTLFV